MSTIQQKYSQILGPMLKNRSQSQTITEHNVFQPGSTKNRPYIDKIVEDHLLPGSGIIGCENLIELYELCKQGKSCLILVEHYSNFDLPNFIYLLDRCGDKGKEAANSVVAMAGMKLNVESKTVLLFTEIYSRIVIYPSRYHDAIKDPEKLVEERKKSNAINRAALHEMIRCKHSGHMILVFPSGTRYRPGQPDTKRGLKEIDSYIRAFDYMVLVGIGGNILRLNPSGEMEEDFLVQDTVLLKASPVLNCEEFRTKTRNRTPADADPKQFVVDRVMHELELLHEEIEKVRATP